MTYNSRNDAMSEKVNTDPRPPLIQYFRDYSKSKRGFEPDTPFSAMMNMMHNKFEPIDLKTGEQFVEYPKMEGWQREVEGFFEDRFAHTTNYFFGYFLKRYGSFGRPPKRNVLGLVVGLANHVTTPIAQSPNERYRCKDCGRIHSPFADCGG